MTTGWIPITPIPNVTKRVIKSSPSGVKIPLHAGSKVLVNKDDLIRIYSTIPAVYTARLSELVLSKPVLEAWPIRRNIDFLEPEKMFSLTSEIKNNVQAYLNQSILIDTSFVISEHVVQLFQRSQAPVTKEMVYDFVKHHIRLLQKTPKKSSE